MPDDNVVPIQTSRYAEFADAHKNLPAKRSTPTADFDWEDAIGEEHDRSKFFIWSTDYDTDKTMHFRVNVPARVGRMVREMIQGNLVPRYRTAEDFFRDAAVHRLHDIGLMHNLPSRFSDLLSAIEAETSGVASDDYIEQMSRSIEAVKRALQRAWEEGDDNGVRKLLSQNRRRAAGLRQPWRDRMFEILDEYERKM